MQRRLLLWLLATFFLTAVSFADAQQAGKYHVGRLSGGETSSTFSIDAIRRELRQLGYVEARTLFCELRSAEENPDRLRSLADELVRLKSMSSSQAVPTMVWPPRRLPRRSPSYSRIRSPIRSRVA
jgi:hypothetical protein